MSAGDTEATHECVVCGALWRLNQPLSTRDTGMKPGYPLHRASWTLVSAAAGDCCDMEPMDGPNIAALPIEGFDEGMYP